MRELRLGFRLQPELMLFLPGPIWRWEEESGQRKWWKGNVAGGRKAGSRGNFVTEQGKMKLF